MIGLIVGILLGTCLILYLFVDTNNNLSTEEIRQENFVTGLTNEDLNKIFAATPMANLYDTDPLLVDYLLAEKNFRGL